MIKIDKLNKYFNRYRKNQLHVINNTSLVFEDKGLVSLLGPSGSGKTTLLNVIGGLDSARSGSVYIDNKKITSRFSYKRDKIRNLNIGYIFQDYKLVDNLSVFDNVSLVLKMIGIKDKKEIEKRVNYVLEKVSMYRYRNRPCNMLSGGERQRVGIARAIVKNPNIIIADEPTGNLDSKNSLEIMNIIKAISKDKLVILVTHETNLAKFYSDRIIEISDGKIEKDYLNKHEDDLDYVIDNRIYLKDIKTNSKSKIDNCSINYYSDEENPIELEIIVKKDNIYIQTKSNKNIEVVDENSSVEIINDSYKMTTQDEVNKYNFDFKNIINEDKKLKYSSIFNPISFISNGFKKVFGYSFIKKILLFGFFLSGIFIMISSSRIAANLRVEDKNFVTMNKNYLTIETRKINTSEYEKYKNEDLVLGIMPTDSIVSFKLNLNSFYQTSKQELKMEGSLSSLDMINKDDITKGVFPTNSKEIVVDKLTISKLLKIELSQMMGLINSSDLIGMKLSVIGLDDYTIVGITDKESPSVYVDNGEIQNILYYQKDSTKDIYDYNLFRDELTIKEGREPVNDYEVLINYSLKDSVKLNKEIKKEVNGVKLKVVGYYTSVNNLEYHFTNSRMINYELLSTSKNISIYTNDKDTLINNIRSKYNVNIRDSYEVSRERYIKDREKGTNVAITSSVVVLIISFIEILLMLRASFLSRIKEVGIYRAIGVKKKDIYIMFMGEIIAITTLASLPGVLLSAYVLNSISKMPYLGNEFFITIPLVIFTFICLVIFNLVVGLIPVFNTIRKTPSQILSRTDI